MNRLKFLLATLVVAVVTLGIYSCAKDAETNTPLSKSNDKVVESRASNSACSPQTLWTEYTGCTHQPDSLVISFALSYSLYSTSSKIYQLCPGQQLKVYFTKSRCFIGATGAEVYFVRDLSYNLNALIASCPALQAELAYQQSQGNLVSFLDFLDDDVSRQLEFTLAYNAAKQPPYKYNCDKKNYYSVKYIKNTCYVWKALPNPETGKWTFAKRDCGNTVCCARSNDYCAQTFVNGEPVLTIGQSTQYQKFEGTCSLECTHDCGAPDPNSF